MPVTESAQRGLEASENEGLTAVHQKSDRHSETALKDPSRRRVCLVPEMPDRSHPISYKRTLS